MNEAISPEAEEQAQSPEDLGQGYLRDNLASFRGMYQELKKPGAIDKAVGALMYMGGSSLALNTASIAGATLGLALIGVGGLIIKQGEINRKEHEE